jgi:hypothetical protein
MPADQSKRISVQTSAGVSMSEALILISEWYRRHEVNPERWPMTGVFCWNSLKCWRRNYRKTDCFLVWKDKEESA